MEVLQSVECAVLLLSVYLVYSPGKFNCSLCKCLQVLQLYFQFNVLGMWFLNETVSSSLLEVPSNSHSSNEVEDYWNSTSQDPNPLLLHENSEVVNSAERFLSNKTNDDEEPLVNITGKYLLKVKEENRLTQTTVQNIAKATSELFLVACNRLKQKIEETLKDENAKRFPEIEAAFEDVTSPFEQLNAKWMFPEFTRDKLPYVVSYITFKSCQSEKKGIIGLKV